MSMTLLSLFTLFPYVIGSLRTSACVPNTQFILNGRVCRCDNLGQWTEENCKLNLKLDRRKLCQPGTILSQGCNQCICTENGQLSCTDDACPRQATDTVHLTLSRVLDWCTPFRSYFVNCNICVCPASGKSAEARCALDTSCAVKKQPSTPDFSARNTCIPNVMYLFSCLHCLCSDEGAFSSEKCVDTCPRRPRADPVKRCNPGTLYRKGCNVCLCPANGAPDDRSCTKSFCDKVNVKYLNALRSQSRRCTPYSFTKPRCLYCDCGRNGTVDESSCFELECLKSDDFKYDKARSSCNAGEIVGVCVECLCLRYGQTSEEYCSRSCSHYGKLKVIEKLVADTRKNDQLIDKNFIKNPSNNVCQPNTVYNENRKYCLCPDNGNTNFNLCTSTEDIKEPPRSESGMNASIDLNAKCEPHTFVEFDCNSCFCSKNGTIDPLWCTYDDCEAKRLVQEAHATYEIAPSTKERRISHQCIPGSMSREQCNYCICPNSGLTKERVCTKNVCVSAETVGSESLVCEPLAYYEVDCNVCFCPRDGVKNVAKCTKNHCEKSFLRSEVCIPGQLFTDECNVCVCPPNGSKEDRACTNYTCTDTASWQKIFQLSESLIETHNQVGEDATRNLDLCFPGEEFVVGCKLCVCPDMGLRDYAVCSPTVCADEDKENKTIPEAPEPERASHRGVRSAASELPGQPFRRAEDCLIFNFTLAPLRKECTPGSMYIVRCRQCICPYMGSINPFCRPLPKEIYCEQAFHNVNYMAMGRRANKSPTNTPASPSFEVESADLTSPMTPQSAHVTSSTTSSLSVGATANLTSNSSDSKPSFNDVKGSIKHYHTIYPCDKDKIGKVMNDCFICECEPPGRIIEEHCFKSEKEECVDATPNSFFEKLVN